MNRNSATYWINRIADCEQIIKTGPFYNVREYTRAREYAKRKLAKLRARCGTMANARKAGVR